MKKKLLLFLSTIICFIHCNKKVDLKGTDLSQTIQTSIQGNILNISNQPVEGVLLKIGGVTTTTDSLGFFKIPSINLKIKATVIEIQKAGYFSSLKTINATQANNYVRIIMLPKTLAGTFNSITGGDISLPNGSTMSLPPNGL